jgi:hypothetical protein
VNGDDEIKPGKNRRKSSDKHAERRGNHRSMGKAAAIGCVERPAGVNSAGNHGVEREDGADDVDVPAEKIEAWKCQVPRADHHGHKKIPERGRDGRHQEKENHDDAVHGEQLVVGFRLDQRALRLDQVQAHQNGKSAADKEHQRNGSEIEKRDAFVVRGQKPGLHAILRIQIIDARPGRNFVNV